MRSSELLSRFIKASGQPSTAWRDFVLAMLLLVVPCTAQSFAETPIVGQKAPDFTLRTPTGTSVELSKQSSASTVVLVVLRGFPGYQCPYCQKQVHDFVEHASEFAAKKASVLLVYPGPAADLDQHAREFLEKQANLPSNVTLVTDPEYAMTKLYDLRWDAPSETAYPSTFIIDRKGMITFEKITHSHDDRSTARGILAEISGK
jgi:thioredoxin-dependent peroxiredoxin